MKIIAFDLSTVSTGFAIFKDNKLVQSGTFQVKEKYSIDAKLCLMGNRIGELLCKNLDTDFIVNESPVLVLKGRNKKTGESYSQNTKGIFSLGGIHGYLKVSCFRYGLSYKEMQNKKWKSHIAGGSASKEQTKDFLEKIYKIKTDTTDESDAVGIGIAFLAEFNNKVRDKK